MTCQTYSCYICYYICCCHFTGGPFSVYIVFTQCSSAILLVRYLSLTVKYFSEGNVDPFNGLVSNCPACCAVLEWNDAKTCLSLGEILNCTCIDVLLNTTILLSSYSLGKYCIIDKPTSPSLFLWKPHRMSSSSLPAKQIRLSWELTTSSFSPAK